MKSQTRSRDSGGASFLSLLVLLSSPLFAGGCASEEVVLVNKAAIAYRASPSDEGSRERAMNTIAMLQEQEKDYRLGPDDELSVSIFEWMVREETKEVGVRVSETGFITLPLIGAIDAEGKSIQEIEEIIVKRLKEGGFINLPRVSVRVKEFRSKAIAVVGAVENPGRFHIRQNVITLLDALSMAGGLDNRAGYVLYVLRPRSAAEYNAAVQLRESGTSAVIRVPGGQVDLPVDQADLPATGQPDLSVFTADRKKEIIVVDLIELLEEGRLQMNVVLSDRDVVFVPEAHLFYVVGFVRKPGGFSLKRPTTILDAIALAEGLMENEASPRDCFLKRRSPEGEIILSVDLVAISEGENPNLFLQPNDIIDVRQTAWKRVRIQVYDFLTRLFSFGYNLADLGD